jgi:UDP-hydrolysing UDP-N-acetyl-D-glucosamine 2-epimerase
MVLAVSGARSDFEYLRPVVDACARRDDVSAAFLLLGGHLSSAQGRSLETIRREGCPVVATVENLLASDSRMGRGLSFTHACGGLLHRFQELNPDVILIAGDREEALAAAIAGNFLGLPVAHIHGGDRCLASDIDEVFRPAISKLAHWHFAATGGHRQRLIQMGEREDRVWAVGAVSLDTLKQRVRARESLPTRFPIPPGAPYFLVIHHPSPTLGESVAIEEAEAILDGLAPLGHPIVWGMPNFDPGNIRLREWLGNGPSRYARLVLYDHLPAEEFYGWYAGATAIVGNSSSIVIESGFLGVPGILVGRRQDLREIGPNVRRAPADPASITALGREALDPSTPLRIRHTLYGDGNASSTIANILATAALDEDLLRKVMTY